eukprot:3231601-Rhodomonas_salina.2
MTAVYTGYLPTPTRQIQGTGTAQDSCEHRHFTCLNNLAASCSQYAPFSITLSNNSPPCASSCAPAQHVLRTAHQKRSVGHGTWGKRASEREMLRQYQTWGSRHEGSIRHGQHRGVRDMA